MTSLHSGGVENDFDSTMRLWSLQLITINHILMISIFQFVTLLGWIWCCDLIVGFMLHMLHSGGTRSSGILTQWIFIRKFIEATLLLESITSVASLASLLAKCYSTFGLSDVSQ